jgi:membrane protease YdiL (CAAX protease family)
MLIVHKKVNNMQFMNIQSYSVLLIDHTFVAAFAIVFPVLSYFGYKKSLKAYAAGTLVRSREYAYTIAIQWLIAFSALAIWQTQNREWTELGFSGSPDGKFMIAAAIVILVVVLLIWQLLAVRRADEKIMQELDSAFEELKPLMPESTGELHTFYGLAFTAGIVEELLWRGYLIWYLTHFVPLWVAAIISAVLFGLAHSYQGIKSVPKVTAVGLALAGLYVLSGSLWLPILAHILADMVQGRTAFDYFRVRSSSAAPPGAALEV